MPQPKTTAVWIATLLILLILGPARADLIVNGGFESPELDDGTWSYFNNITGWSLDGDVGAVEVQNNVAGSPYEGEQFAELDSTRPSAIYQDVATVAGQYYTLTFAFAARAGTSREADNVMRVTWGGVQIFKRVAPDFAPNWTVYSFNVQASGGETRLLFADASPNTRNSYGVYLDDVQLVARIPEPAPLALLGLGLAAMGFIGRRKI